VKNKIEFKVCNQGNNPKAYKECQQFIEKWQELLRIQDWKIILEFYSAKEIEEFELGEMRAVCERVFENKTAKICINIESENEELNASMEDTLLHELLHIVTGEYAWFAEEYSDKSKQTISVLKLKLEQLVESLAKSFVVLGGKSAGKY